MDVDAGIDIDDKMDDIDNEYDGGCNKILRMDD